MPVCGLRTHEVAHDVISTSSSSSSCGSPVSCRGEVFKDRYRLVILGGPRVGKTTLVHQFLFEDVPEKYKPTVEEFHLITCDDVTLEVIDTSGSDEFPAMRSLAIAKSDAVVLVFAVDDAASFEEVRRLRDLVMELRPSGVPTVVVANKCDLEPKRNVRREVSEGVVTIDWEQGYAECSALKGQGVREAFAKLVNQESARHLMQRFQQKMQVGLDEKRRQSLPVFGASHRIKDLVTPKRNSCAMS